MIEREEIDQQAAVLGVSASNVQRDYVFGWLLAGLQEEGSVSKEMVLKGGNALRKAYFRDARFSPDLDFGGPGTIDPDLLRGDLQRACAMVEARSGVRLEGGRTVLRPKTRVDDTLSVWDARLYFSDFYGRRSTVTVSVRMDVTEFDRLVLGPAHKPLLHDYSDADQCKAEIKTVHLEELIATKLKCLLQRKHVADLYDVVHWLVFGIDQVDKQSVIDVFLRKTIYRSDPGAAGNLLRGLAFDALEGLWSQYIVCATSVRVAFRDAVNRFIAMIGEMFPEARQWGRLAFFGAEERNAILEAGRSQTVLKVVYDGSERLVEPYSLKYKRPQSGAAAEYLYVHDRSGGRSGPGIKSFIPARLTLAQLTEEKFEPRFPIELAKAGEPADRPNFKRRTGLPSFFLPRPSRRGGGNAGSSHTYRCSACDKTFRRQRRSSMKHKHKNSLGTRCVGGFMIFEGTSG